MWLLKLHFSISVLCLLTFLGFYMISVNRIKKNGYGSIRKKMKKLSTYFIFFVPILNIFSVITIFIMCCMRIEDFYKMCGGAKNDGSDGK